MRIVKLLLALVFLCLTAIAAEAPTTGKGEKTMGWDKITPKLSKLSEHQQKIAASVRDLLETYLEEQDTAKQEEFMEGLGYREGLSLADIVRKDGDFYQTLVGLFGENWAELMRKYWERQEEFPFPTLYSKEWAIEGSIMWVRSHEPYRYFPACLRVLKWLVPTALEQDADSFIEEGKKNYATLGARLGLLLDEYDPDSTLFNKISGEIRQRGVDPKEAGYCGELVAGLLASHREDATKFLQ